MNTLNAATTGTEAQDQREEKQDAYADLLKELTRRLEMDQELRLDVMAELRGHLEDSAAEYRAAGLPPDEARSQAIKALGDARELEEQLWQANRRRVRLRWVMKWVAQVALLPIAILLTLVVFTGALNSINLTGDLMSGGTKLPPRFSAGFVHMLDAPFWGDGSAGLLNGLTPEQRLVFEGDTKTPDLALREKAITDRWPDNPIYYGNYINRRYMTVISDIEHGRFDAGAREAFFEELDNGRRLEPENAFYDFLKATVLLEMSAKLADHPARLCQSPAPPGNGAPPWPCQKVEATDRPLFEQAFVEFRKGLGKPYCTSHAVDMAKVRLDLLPASRSLTDEIYKSAQVMGVVLPTVHGFKGAAERLSAHALGLAEAGQGPEALELLRDVQIMGAKVGADARCIIEVMEARAMVNIAMDYRVNALDALGMASQKEAAFQQLLAERDFYWTRVRSTQRLDEQTMAAMRSSFFLSLVTPSVAGYKPSDTASLRQVEYALLDRMALSAFMAVLELVALGLGVLAAAGWLVRRQREASPMLFVGWRHLGRICLLAIVLPLGAYLAWLYLAPWGRRDQGAHFTFQRVLLEYLVLFAVSLSLLQHLTYQAICRRAMELGLPVPSAAGRAARIAAATIGGVLVLGVVSFMIAWHITAARTKSFSLIGFGYEGAYVSILGAGIALYVMGVGVWRWLRCRKLDGFGRTMARSAVSIFAVAAIVLGVLCGLSLSRVEATAAGRGTLSKTLFEEIERSNYRELRGRLVEQHAKLLAEK